MEGGWRFPPYWPSERWPGKTVDLSQDQEKGPKDESSDVTAQAKRKDSRRHFENTSQIGDVSEIVSGEPPHMKRKQAQKPGILINEHAAAATKLLQGAKTGFSGDPTRQSGNGEKT